MVVISKALQFTLFRVIFIEALVLATFVAFLSRLKTERGRTGEVTGNRCDEEAKEQQFQSGIAGNSHLVGKITIMNC